MTIIRRVRIILARFFIFCLIFGEKRGKKGDFTSSSDEVETIVPFGGSRGYISALLVQVLSGSLMNMPMRKKDGKFRGVIFIAINSRKFTDYNKFVSANSKLIKQIKSLKKEKKVKEISIPGDRSRKNKGKILKRGYFAISDELYSRLTDLR